MADETAKQKKEEEGKKKRDRERVKVKPTVWYAASEETRPERRAWAGSLISHPLSPAAKRASEK